MYSQLNAIFADQKGEVIFTCFGIWHFLYLFFIIGTVLLVLLWLRNKEQNVKERASAFACNFAFALYMADLFLMPFAYGEIDVDKLPFHACTAMCIMGFWSRHNSFLGKFKLHFAMLGMVSNLMYIVCPMGVADYEIHPLSYRAVQTLLFHGAMTAQGIFMLAFDNIGDEWKKWYKSVGLVLTMSLWAILGNTFYTGAAGDYSHDFNWFFVKRDPFGLFPEPLSHYLMPLIMPIVMLAMEVLIYCIYFGIRYWIRQSTQRKKLADRVEQA